MTSVRTGAKSSSAGVLVTATVAELALFDRESPVNRPGRYEAARADSWSFKREEEAFSEEELARAGDRYDQYWNQLQERGDILVWRGGSGVYRVDVLVLADRPKRRFSGSQRAAFLAGRDVERRLRCPSGRLVVGCLKDLGAAGPLAARVRPGSYRVGLVVDEGERGRHRGLAEPGLYPEGDGPDFILTLQRDSR